MAAAREAYRNIWQPEGCISACPAEALAKADTLPAAGGRGGNSDCQVRPWGDDRRGESTSRRTSKPISPEPMSHSCGAPKAPQWPRRLHFGAPAKRGPEIRIVRLGLGATITGESLYTCTRTPVIVAPRSEMAVRIPEKCSLHSKVYPAPCCALVLGLRVQSLSAHSPTVPQPQSL